MPKVGLLFFCTFLLVPSGRGVTFQNVTVSLTTQLPKLFFFGTPPVENIFIQSSNSLSEHVNLQPLEVVIIQNARIPQLETYSVSNLPNIVHVSIIQSGVKEVRPGAFENIPKVDSINLESNQIETIRDGVFTNLRIKSLYLGNNKISTIANSAFNNMTLTTISLKNNKIARWNPNWFNGSPVGSVYFSGNLLEELPADAFAYGLQFKKINIPLTAWHVVLAQNRLRRVDKHAFRHVNGFIYLSLADNQLEELPREVFDSVKNINTLDLSDNRLSKVDGLFDDINIHQLVLINNSLSCFPLDVFDKSHIDLVFVDGNPFRCQCVEKWKNIQMANNANVLYNMNTLEANCVK